MPSRSLLLPCVLTLASLSTAWAAGCTPPKTMFQGRASLSPLLKFDCARTKGLTASYDKSFVKPKWVEVYQGSLNKETAQVVTALMVKLHQEGFRVEEDERDPQMRGYTFRKGKVVLGGQLIILRVVLNPSAGQMWVVVVGR